MSGSIVDSRFAFVSRSVLLSFLIVFLMAACGSSKDVVVGSATVPVEFGELSSPLFGCSDLEGLYAWPPAEGAADEGVPRNAQGPRLPTLVPLATPLYREAQLWIAKIGSGGAVDVRSRMVNRNQSLRIGSLTNTWSQAELTASELDCKDGAWVYLAPPPEEGILRQHYQAFLLKDHGAERAELGIHLQRLENGDLVIGQWTRLIFRASGRRGPPDAGESVLDPPDRVIWHWSRLKRVGDTGEGVPPDDAALAREN